MRGSNTKPTIVSKGVLPLVATTHHSLFFDDDAPLSIAPLPVPIAFVSEDCLYERSSPRVDLVVEHWKLRERLFKQRELQSQQCGHRQAIRAEFVNRLPSEGEQCRRSREAFSVMKELLSVDSI